MRDKLGFALITVPFLTLFCLLLVGAVVLGVWQTVGDVKDLIHASKLVLAGLSVPVVVGFVWALLSVAEHFKSG